MVISSIQTGIVDFGNRLSATVFFTECNIKPYCPFCYNKKMMEEGGWFSNSETIQEIENISKTMPGYPLGVVMSGGEPVINKGFHKLVKALNSKSYPLALHTNGITLPSFSKIQKYFERVVMSLKPYSILKIDFEEYKRRIQEALNYYSSVSDCALHIVDIPRYREEYKDILESIVIPEGITVVYVKPVKGTEELIDESENRFNQN